MHELREGAEGVVLGLSAGDDGVDEELETELLEQRGDPVADQVMGERDKGTGAFIDDDVVRGRGNPLDQGIEATGIDLVAVK
jgi:hypothetical protein